MDAPCSSAFIVYRSAFPQGIMFHLTREVRFAINPAPDEQFRHPPTNSFGGYPSLTSGGRFYTAQVTLAGQLRGDSHYLENIKTVDASVREFLRTTEKLDALSPVQILGQLYQHLENRWPRELHSVVLALSPYCTIGFQRSEHPMMRLSQKFEFSASHRLHNPTLSDEENRRLFGKCNNPFGHGHNYELQVTLRGTPDNRGVLIELPAFERIVSETVIDRFDHKNLNLELAEFHELIPSVENIAMTIYQLLKPRFADARASLAGVTVWETPKTWCEYSE
jgi:6-pyruvoyltetrahydropterin/6-carboxytetrahydropterin synthase